MEDKYKTTPERLANSLYTNAFSQGFYDNILIRGSSPYLNELKNSFKRRGIPIVEERKNHRTWVINLDDYVFNLD